ncbi:kelch-like protein 28 [Episyrphus balteatus]|uniref:kelch-like protein 28 n=1 Tax=Episyrphus balteatus TaxID=286459 RepID=UPI0024852D9D|nr:kelch-like protein 28 [Episyrphus balteatus]
MFSLFEKEEYSDISIISSDKVTFNAHKIVLASGSDFFSAMFEIPLKESKSNEVTIQQVNGDNLKHILAFLYTGIIELQAKTVPEILSAAHFFQIQSLIFECQQFMEEELDSSNCLAVALFAEQLDLKDLYGKAIKFACKNFDLVSNTEDFLFLNQDQMTLIYSNEDLYVTSEEKVFLSLIIWIDYDKSKREQFAHKLLSHVQYWLLSPEFIKQNRNKLPNDAKTVEIIFTWLEWHLSPNSSEVKYRKRKCSSDKLVIIQKDKMSTYHPGVNIWKCKSLPGFPATFEKVVEVRDKLIVKTENVLKSFDLKTNEMNNLPQFDIQLSNFGLAVLKNELYVVGGRDGNGWTKLVQKFNFSSNEWEAISSMSKPLSNPVIAVDGRYLHVKGDEEFMGSFDPNSNDWTWTHFPYPAFSCFGFAGVNDKLFIIGQQSGMKSSCVYEYSNGKWSRQQMRLALNSPKCISWNNRLIACGKNEEYDKLNLLMEYEPESNRWKCLDPLYEYTVMYDIVNVGSG